MSEFLKIGKIVNSENPSLEDMIYYIRHFFDDSIDNIIEYTPEDSIIEIFKILTKGAKKWKQKN